MRCECHRFLVSNDRLSQLPHRPRRSDQQFADFVSEWWETHAQVRLRPGTLASYAYQLDRWIIPFLDEIPLRELSRGQSMGTSPSSSPPKQAHRR
jgi:Phage integrase, N-terminal SAM-like domain